MRTHILPFIPLALLTALAVPSAAGAHAFLDHAEPRVGSEVKASPTEVRIWFTQHLESTFSAIEVFDADGKQVDKKDCHVDEKDPSLLIVSVPALAAGTYKVAWHVVSVDTHRTKGDFKFTVKP
jgi:methionine-rich copper-binding protein CopC